MSSEASTISGMSWQVPTAHEPLDAVVTVPGSKSQTARLLVLAALAEGTTRLRAPLHARDTELMAAGLRRLGHDVSAPPDAPGDWLVTGGTGGRGWTGGTGGTGSTGGTQASAIDVGNSGTVTRFLPAVAALGRADVTFDGDSRIRERPVGPLLASLRELGATIDDGGRGALPLVVRGTGSLRGGTTAIDASTSSQLVSGLLLAGPETDLGVEVRHVGERVPSGPYLSMTVAELRRFGAEVTEAQDSWRVAAGRLTGRDVAVEPDLSSALPFLVAPLLAGGTVTLAGWPIGSVQPGAVLPDLLARLGAGVELTGGSLHVRGTGQVHGFDDDFADFGEAVPVLAALALFADGPSRIRGVAHLRSHETDRLRALAEELGRLGGDVRETDDGVEIHPVAGLVGTALDPRADHRLAMAYAVAGLRVAGITVSDPGTVAKTVPDFRERWARMLRSD